MASRLVGSGFEAPFDEDLGVGMDTELGDGDAVERSVGLAVSAEVEAETFLFG